MTPTALVISGSAADDPEVARHLGGLLVEGPGVGLRVYRSRGPGEGPDLARQALDEGAERLVAVGGDGTVHEVAPVAAAAGVPLGIWPQGTGNDLARHLGLTDLAPDRALQVALRAAPVAMDLATMGDTTFVNVASLGPIATVAPNTPRALKDALGPTAYVLSALGTLAELEPFRARLVGHGFELEDRWLALFIGNGSRVGGGHVLLPDARLDSGLFEVLAIRAPEGPALVSVLGRAALKRLDADVHTVRTKTPWIEVQSDAEVPVSLDGEPTTIRTTRFEIRPAALAVAVPDRSGDPS